MPIPLVSSFKILKGLGSYEFKKEEKLHLQKVIELADAFEAHVYCLNVHQYFLVIKNNVSQIILIGLCKTIFDLRKFLNHKLHYLIVCMTVYCRFKKLL